MKQQILNRNSMKKLLFFIFSFIFFLGSNLHAQINDTAFKNVTSTENANMKKHAPYYASVGGIISPAFPVMAVAGVSYKSFMTKNLAFQTDILIKTMLTGNINERTIFYSGYVTNTNILYQKKLKEQKNANLFWFFGGGASLGFTITGNAKFGANAIIGLEYLFHKKNLAIQLDLRPGYGILFSSYSQLNRGWLPPLKNPWSHFDWCWGVTFRYVFKEKVS